MPLIAALLVVVVIALVIGWLQDQVALRRVGKLRAKAEALGLRFEEEAPQLQERLPHFALFGQGERGKVRHAMFGRTEVTVDGQPQTVEMVVFEYTFGIPMGRYVRSWRQTVVYLSAEQLRLPPFMAVPDQVFDMIVLNTKGAQARERLLGVSSIDFRDDPEFRRRVQVQGTDRDAVRSLFTERVRALWDGERALCVEGEGSHLILYDFDEVVHPQGLEPLIERARDVLQRLLEAQAALGEQGAITSGEGTPGV